MQFAVAPGASAWSLNVFGDEDFGLLWDPTPDEVCDFEDPNCDPSVPPIPFALVLPDDIVPDGLARVASASPRRRDRRIHRQARRQCRSPRR